MTDTNLTVVFTDIVAFSKMSSSLDQETLLRKLHRHEELLLPIVIRHDGNVINTIGSSFMLLFENANSAVRCGLVMQHTLQEQNANASDEEKFEIRIGISTGEVISIGNDVYGDTVNLALQIMQVCTPGAVYFSTDTYVEIERTEVPTTEVGEFSFKNTDQKQRIYRVNSTDDTVLFDRILADQIVLERTYINHKLPSGVYSENLLHTLERQRNISQTNSGNGRWIFASAILLILALPATYGITQLNQQSQVRHAANLLRNQDSSAALPLLMDLQRKRPADRRIPVLLGFAVVIDVQNLLQTKLFTEALQQIEAHKTRFPFLNVYPALERTVRLSQTQFKETQAPEAPGETFEELRHRYPNDLDIRERHAASLALKGDDKGAMHIYLDVIENHPEYALKPTIRKHLEHCLNQYVDEDLQQTIAKHLFNDLASALQPNLYAPDAPTLRRNSFAIFSMAGAEVDPVTFYTVELLTGSPLETERLDSTLRFFEHQVINGATSTLVASTPIVTDEIPILELYEGANADRSLAVINALFAERLRPLLQQFVSDQAKRGHRLNSYRVLLAHSWLTRDLESAYHLANIADHNAGEAHAYELFSATWMADEGPSDIKEQAIPLLQKNRADLTDTIERWTSSGNGSRIVEHKALLEQTEKALRRLGG